MKIFQNTAFTKRISDCTNIVACVGEAAPNERFVETDASVLVGLTQLHRQAGVTFYGYM